MHLICILRFLVITSISVLFFGLVFVPYVMINKVHSSIYAAKSKNLSQKRVKIFRIRFTECGRPHSVVLAAHGSQAQRKAQPRSNQPTVDSLCKAPNERPI